MDKEINVTNLNEALKDNNEKIILVEIPVMSLPANEISQYVGSILNNIRNNNNLKDYEILGIPFRKYKDRLKITKIQESYLNKQGWFRNKEESSIGTDKTLINNRNILIVE